ncbi:hypothetical protein SUGI_0309600 [Cryptomeria japonica]|nr:hypothetical protein SUGI_0309600 [Cryptomeria japonica]
MIMSPLCIATLTSNVHCSALCLTLCSIYTENNLQCALPFSVSQNKQASIYAHSNLNCLLLPPLCHSVTENNELVHSSLLPRYDVFLNHRGADVKESVASLIFYNLQNKGFKVFLDKKSIQGGENIAEAIEEAIHSASVHLVIFSPNYAQSVWCLKELKLILETGAPIVPVFYGVKPSELRMREENSVYGEAFQRHKHTGNFEPHTLEEWKRALYEVSYIKGHIFTG